MHCRRQPIYRFGFPWSHTLQALVLGVVVLLPRELVFAQQDTTSVLVGTVYAEAGQPLADVELLLDDELTVRTDPTGSFRVPGVLPGNHVLMLSARGFASRTFRFTVPEGSAGEIDLGAVMLEVVLGSMALLGTVSDSRTGEPIPAAVLTLDGTVSVATNISGNFRLSEVTPGTHLLYVKRIGFKRAMLSLNLPSNQTGVDLDIRLDPVPVELPEVVVEGERTLYAYGRLRDFYERRNKGIGHFVTRWDIEKRKPRVASEMLAGISSLRIVPGPLGRNTIELSDQSLSCRTPLLFVDGTLIRGGNPDEVLTPQDIEGMEIYTRVNEVPLEFSIQAGAACGVIAVWTR